MATSKPTESDNKRELLQAAFDALRPIARLLRSTGLDQSDLKLAFERAVAACEGEVPRGVNVDLDLFERIANVAAQWSQDRDFQDDRGVPKILSVSAGSHSFETLCRQVSPSIDPTTALSVLREFGSVKILHKKQVMLLSRITLQAYRGRFLSFSVLNEIQRYVETIEYNALDRGAEDGLLQARASHGNGFAPGAFKQVHEFIRRLGVNFLEDAEKKMAENALPDSKDGERYGVGVYVYRVQGETAPKVKSPKLGSPRRKPTVR